MQLNMVLSGQRACRYCTFAKVRAVQRVRVDGRRHQGRTGQKAEGILPLHRACLPVISPFDKDDGVCGPFRAELV